MLQNPDWDKPKTKHNWAELIAWLERQPARKRYDYSDRGCCLAAQFNQLCGRKYMPSLAMCDDGSVISVKGRRNSKFDVVLERVAMQAPHTFGAALKRARREFARASG